MDLRETDLVKLRQKDGGEATHQTLLLLGVPFAHVDDNITCYDLELTDHDSSSEMPAFIILTLQYKDKGIEGMCQGVVLTICPGI